MLITACADAGETDRAFKYLKWMEDDGLHNESLNMRVCIGLLEVGPTLPTDAIYVPSLVRSCTVVNHQSCDVAGISRAEHALDHGPVSSVSAQLVLTAQADRWCVQACAKTGDLARATIVTDRMQQGGLQHNVETAACLLGTYRTAMAAYDDHDSRVALLAECDAIFQHSRGFTVSGDVVRALPPP